MWYLNPEVWKSTLARDKNAFLEWLPSSHMWSSLWRPGEGSGYSTGLLMQEKNALFCQKNPGRMGEPGLLIAFPLVSRNMIYTYILAFINFVHKSLRTNLDGPDIFYKHKKAFETLTETLLISVAVVVVFVIISSSIIISSYSSERNTSFYSCFIHHQLFLFILQKPETEFLIFVHQLIIGLEAFCIVCQCCGSCRLFYHCCFLYAK